MILVFVASILNVLLMQETPMEYVSLWVVAFHHIQTMGNLQEQ